MTFQMTYEVFYEKLKHSLPVSTGKDRKELAKIIATEHYNIERLSDLLFEKPKIASRFIWLLSDFGEVSPSELHKALPFLLKRCLTLKTIDYKISFANYWLIAGIPEENEAQAIDLLFSWLQDPKVNVTTKSRALFVLVKLTDKYPDLKYELRLCLEDQLEKNTKSFKTRAEKVLKTLSSSDEL